MHPGIVHSIPVAIKTFKRTVDINDFKAVPAELKIMAYLEEHDFIVKFVGAEISEISKRETCLIHPTANRNRSFIFTHIFYVIVFAERIVFLQENC